MGREDLAKVKNVAFPSLLSTVSSLNARYDEALHQYAQRKGEKGAKDNEQELSAKRLRS